jgi:acyl CoA:acetate/3-ketoacid CoA transferase
MAPPKETREFNGKSYVMEEAIYGDYAFVKVAKADRLGNCTFRKAQNNFNEAMGKNAKMTIVEADEIVEDGVIAPEEIHLQGVYVKRVIKSTEEKKIERLVYYKDPEEQKKAILEGEYCRSHDERQQVLILEQAPPTRRRNANVSSSAQPRSLKMACMSTSVSACRSQLLLSFPRVSRSCWSPRTASLEWADSRRRARKTRTLSTQAKRQ